MKNIVPVTDLQRQAGQLISSLADSDEPIVITQRGRATAVLISAEQFANMESDLRRLDELELLALLDEAQQAKTENKIISHNEVKKRMGFVS